MLTQKQHEVDNCIETKKQHEVQNYIETKFNIVYPNQKPKEYLRRQLTLLTKTPEEPTVEENYDAFGNEIVRRCLGNDGNIYDIQSMSYLFQQDEQGHSGESAMDCNRE